MNNFYKKEIFLFSFLILILLVSLPKSVVAWTEPCGAATKGGCTCSRTELFCSGLPSCTYACPARANATVSNGCQYTYGTGICDNATHSGDCVTPADCRAGFSCFPLAPQGTCTYTCVNGYIESGNSCIPNNPPPGNCTSPDANGCCTDANGQHCAACNGNNLITYSCSGALCVSSPPQVCPNGCSGNKCNLPPGQQCTAMFDSNSYEIGQTITISYNNAPAGSTLALRDKDGKNVQTWTVSGSSNVTYTLKAGDPLGLWDIILLKIGDINCPAEIHDEATVVLPEGASGSCTLKLDIPASGHYILGETIIMEFTKVRSGNLALYDPKNGIPFEISDSSLDTSTLKDELDNRKYTLKLTDLIGEWKAVLTGKDNNGAECTVVKKAMVVAPACIHQKPTVIVEKQTASPGPANTIYASPGEQVTYNITVVNNNRGGCDPATFDLKVNPESCPAGWECTLANPFIYNVPQGPGTASECNIDKNCQDSPFYGKKYNYTYTCYHYTDPLDPVTTNICLPKIPLYVESSPNAAFGTYPIDVTVFEPQAGTNFQVTVSAEYIVSYCQVLLNKIGAAMDKECSDPGYDPIADVDKSKTVDLNDLSKVSHAFGHEDVCKGLWEKTPRNPCNISCTIIDDFLNAIKAPNVFNKKCFQLEYDPSFDVNKDKVINVLDIYEMNRKCNGAAGWDSECCVNLMSPIDPCPYCKDLQDKISAAINKECFQPGYDPIADVNKDGKINVVDLSAIGITCKSNEVCCKGLRDSNNKCLYCPVLLEKVEKALGKECFQPGYDPIADTNKGGVVNQADLDAVNNCGGGEGCCKAYMEKTDDPCQLSNIKWLVKNPLKAKNFAEFVDYLINLFLTLGLIIAPICIILAGFYFLSSGGDPMKVKTARNILTYTVIGIAIILLAKGIVELIKRVVGG